MVFASPRTECAAVAEGNSPLVMPEDSALTLQISTLLSASWLRLGLLLVPELWVSWECCTGSLKPLCLAACILPVTLLKVLPIYRGFGCSVGRAVACCTSLDDPVFIVEVSENWLRL